MAAAALRLLHDRNLAEAIGLGARKAAETALSWSSQIARLETWYRGVLAAKA
jgi:glycosyltransferase involved in cell wall biosynthesis